MNMIIWWNCKRYSISKHGVNTMSCTMYSMWFSWRMHSNTSETPHWRHSVLISCITSQNHKWPIHSSWRWRWRVIIVRMHWGHWVRSGLNSSYKSMQMKGLTEKNLEKIFMDRRDKFYRNKGIKLMEKNEINDFIRLWRTFEEESFKSCNDMLRLILTTRSKQLRARKASTILMQTTCMVESCIEWYPMSWWVYINENRWWRRSIKIQSNGWVKSLNTFDKYRYFI